jgi:DNA-binding MarR family transcriptional regulator
MENIKDKDTLHHACELDPRYQNLVAAFRQAVKRENMEQVQTYLLILLISRKLLAEEQALFDRYNLSEGKLSVLLLLKNAPQNQLTPSEIAEATKVTRGTMTGLLAGLERDGYVVRREYPSDGRRFTIQLTEQSLGVIEQLLLERFHHIEKLFACFTPSELDEQRTIIEKLDYQLLKDSFYG